MFTVSIVAAILAGLLALGARAAKKSDDKDSEEIRVTAASAAVVFGVIGASFLGMSSIAAVPANQVGIVTSFGRWDTTVEGWSLVKPWSDVATFSTRNNKSIRDQGEGNEAAIKVKLDGGASAELDATVLYTIDRSQAEQLWREWGSFERLNSDLINRATDNAAAAVYGTYTAEKATSGASRDEITKKIVDRLAKDLKEHGVRLESFTLGDIHLPADVQARINDILAADARIEIAKKGEAAAIAEAAANRARQESLTREALIKMCLDTQREAKSQVAPQCGLNDATGNGVVVK